MFLKSGVQIALPCPFFPHLFIDRSTKQLFVSSSLSSQKAFIHYSTYTSVAPKITSPIYFHVKLQQLQKSTSNI